MNVSLVTNWTSAWRWFSMQSLALIALINTTYAMLPPDFAAQLHLTQHIVTGVTVLISFLGGFGRLILQSDTAPTPASNPFKSGGYVMQRFLYIVAFASFALAAMLLTGCGANTLPKPNTPKTAGVEALVAYGIAGHIAGQYLALPLCTSPVTVVPCKTAAIAAKVSAADDAAYKAAVAADAAANDPGKQSAAAAALTNLNGANAEAKAGKQ